MGDTYSGGEKAERIKYGHCLEEKSPSHLDTKPGREKVSKGYMK